MTDPKPLSRTVAALALFLAGATFVGGAHAQTGDYIVAVVNQELVTAAELQQRMARIREDASRNRTPLPPPAVLRQQVLDALIDDRVLITNAREMGSRVDDAELDRAVANVATQNQLTTAQLRERLGKEGMTYAKFREGIKDQILVERVREREVVGRIRITDAEIDALLAERRQAAGVNAQVNVAQILVAVPDGTSVSTAVELRQRAVAALARVRAGEDFATVAREVSEDSNRARGGEIGLRQVDRLPDLFTKAVAGLKAGEIAPEVLRSEAGFHILKLIERTDTGPFTVVQSRTRHILLRPSAELSAEAAARRLLQFKRDIQSGARTFEQLARANSEDSSAAQGGDLGWTSPGAFVPEFEEAIGELPIGGVSEPVATRFGIHLIQLVDRREVALEPKQQRDQARNILRERKFEGAYTEWLRDLRGRAYIELRDPPS